LVKVYDPGSEPVASLLNMPGTPGAVDGDQPVGAEMDVPPNVLKNATRRFPVTIDAGAGIDTDPPGNAVAP
jgi:hypothetical protein